MVLYILVLSSIFAAPWELIRFREGVPPALTLCSSDSVVVDILYCLQYEGVRSPLLLQLPYLSVLFAFGLYLRCPSSLESSSDSRWGGVAVQVCCQGSLNLVHLLLDVLFYVIRSQSQFACCRAVSYYHCLFSVILRQILDALAYYLLASSHSVHSLI